MMRDDFVSELDLRERNMGVEGGVLLACLLVPVMGSALGGALTNIE